MSLGSAKVAITDTFGPLFIGALIAMGVYGITTLQAYFYYMSFPKDDIPTKLLVGSIWILDTLHIIFMCHALYFYLIIGFGNPQVLVNGVWSLFTSVAVNVIVSLIAQCFFMKRIFQLCPLRIRWWVTGIIGITVLAHIVFGVETVVFLFIKKEFRLLKEVSFIAVVPFGICAVLSDIFIAVALCVLLWRNRSAFKDTNEIINGLIVFAINRCILTSVVAVAETIVFSILPDNPFYSVAIDFVIGKLYANSLLAVLNSRVKLRNSRDALDSTELSTSFHASAVPNHILTQVQTRESSRSRVLGTNKDTTTTESNKCRPLAFSPTSQCQHVQAVCPQPHSLMGIDHLRNYFCTDTSLRPLVFVGLAFWLVFLFSTLGISASDFFTPNLATIAQMLGLDESVAGVTFLAFGNGSPDVFSTFSAMRVNSGSLAIGELLGAATFIVSCVVGSMCIIKPFKVHRVPFLRDVGFFTAAVIVMLLTLWDGKINQWEAGALVVMYVVYVMVAVVSSWWERRQERKRHMDALIRAEYAEEPNFQPYTDRPVPSMEVTPPTPRIRSLSTPLPPRLQIATPPRHYSRSPSPTSPYVPPLPSFSLLGALEFREVVASLKKEATGASLSYFESPVTPYAGGHYHLQNHPGLHLLSQTPQSSSSSSVNETTPNELRMGDRLHPHSAQSTHEELQRAYPDDYFGARQSYQLQATPSIYRIPPSPSATTSDAESEEQLYTPLTKRQRIWSALGKAYHILFPTLDNFRQQSLLTQMACILAAPAVLCLTLTLPVVVTPYNNVHSSHEKIHGDTRLADFEEEGIERTLIAEQEVEENLHELHFSKWLTAVQCILGPLLCVQVLFGNMQYALWLSIAALVTGLAVGALVMTFADTGLGMAGRLIRCLTGFFVSIVWIMAIADEVVSVLQTFGFIFGLSDAIIGLTIFAVGNSLADLVANMTVAVFAPIMGFSACFGGPMLNILLGVGISGSYLIYQTSEPYGLKLSTTLFVSCWGLLFLLATTLFFVPFNDYFLSRRWGMLLIAAYIIIVVINIIVELKS